jgi:hypothetical protein
MEIVLRYESKKGKKLGLALGSLLQGMDQMLSAILCD